MDSAIVTVKPDNLDGAVAGLAQQIMEETTGTNVLRFEKGGNVSQSTLTQLLSALEEHPTTLTQWASVQNLIRDGIQNTDAQGKLAMALHRPEYLSQADRVGAMSAFYLRNPELEMAPLMPYIGRLSPETWSQLDQETVHRMAEATRGLDQTARSQVQQAMSRFSPTAVAGVEAEDVAVLFGQSPAAADMSPAASPLASGTSPTPAKVRVDENGAISLGLAEFSDRRRQIHDNLNPAAAVDVESLQMDGKTIHVWCILHYMSDRVLFQDKSSGQPCDQELSTWLSASKEWDAMALLNQMAEGTDGDFAKDSTFYTNLYGVTLTLAHHVRQASKSMGNDPAVRSAILKTASRVQDWAYLTMKVLDKYMAKYMVVAPELAQSNLVLIYIGQQMSLIQLTHAQSHQKLTALEAQLAKEVKIQIKTLARLHGLQGDKISLKSLPVEDSAEIRQGMQLLADVKKENSRLTEAVNRIMSDTSRLRKSVPESVRKSLD